MLCVKEGNTGGVYVDVGERRVGIGLRWHGASGCVVVMPSKVPSLAVLGVWIEAIVSANVSSSRQ